MKYRANVSITIAALIAIFVMLACQRKVVSSEEPVKNAANSVNAEAAPTPPTNKEPITIAAVGDIMMGSPYPNDSRMPPNDGADLMKEVTPILSAADIAFGNLEGPIVDGGSSGKCGGSRGNCTHRERSNSARLITPSTDSTLGNIAPVSVYPRNACMMHGQSHQARTRQLQEDSKTGNSKHTTKVG